MDLDFACSEDQTVSSLITDWNASLEQNKIIIEEANQQLKAKLDAKEIDPKQFLIGWQPVPQFLRSPGLQWSKWFLRSWGWSLLSRQSDAQASLPYDHYDMVQARAKVAKMTAEDNIHPGLIIILTSSGERRGSSAESSSTKPENMQDSELRGAKPQRGPRRSFIQSRGPADPLQ